MKRLATLVVSIGLGAACGATPSSPYEGLPTERGDGGTGRPGSATDPNLPRDPNDPTGTTPIVTDPFALAGLPKGSEQLQKLCARGQAAGGSDRVLRGFCRNPSITGISDVLRVLGLAFTNANGGNGAAGNPVFAITAHSSALAVRTTSSINPEVFIWNRPEDRPFAAMGFVRGEQVVEMAALDEKSDSHIYYLLVFEQECNKTKCGPGDLLTPAVEKNWTSWTLYEDVDLENTVFDCLHCHQPNGPGQRRILRMQERTRPWTHWFALDPATAGNRGSTGGRSLVADFQAAHGTAEDYGGVPARLIAQSLPDTLQAVIDSTRAQQPNEFNSARIEQEVVETGRSATWQSIFDNYKRGNAIPVPHYGLRPSDPQKLSSATAAYQSFLRGQLPASQLPELHHILSEEAEIGAGIRPAPNSTGREILFQACAQCHNPRLNKNVSRGNFDVTKLDTMSRTMKQIAISRMKLSHENILYMPPERFKHLTEEETRKAIEELEK